MACDCAPRAAGCSILNRRVLQSGASVWKPGSGDWGCLAGMATECLTRLGMIGASELKYYFNFETFADTRSRKILILKATFGADRAPATNRSFNLRAPARRRPFYFARSGCGSGGLRTPTSP